MTLNRASLRCKMQSHLLSSISFINTHEMDKCANEDSCFYHIIQQC